MRSEFDEPKVLGRLVAAYWVTHAVNMDSTKRDTRNKSRLPKPHKEVAADPKQRSHGMSGRIVQQIHVRSLFSLLVRTAVRDGSLYSAYSRNQTAALTPVPGIHTRERRQQLMQSKRRYSGNDAMIHGQQESKNNRSGLRSAMTATRSKKERKFEQRRKQ